MADPTHQHQRSSVIQSSTVASLARRATESSRLLAHARRLIRHAKQLTAALPAWVGSATTTTLLNRIQHAAPHSKTTATAEQGTHWIQHAWLYKWLTEEPDPEVIVIDLRDTYAIGPIITTINTFVATLAPYYPTATLKQLQDAIIKLGTRLANTKPGQLIITLLEPPEPPEHDNDKD